jgi:Protein of unknown function (DUF2793)
MSDFSTNLNLPYILAAQAQKHVTHNEAIRALDAIVQLALLDRDLADPPASPADGDRYVVASAPTGDWTGKAGEIAAFQDGAWAFLTPRAGWRAWVSDEGRLLVYDGADWTAVSGEAEVNPVAMVGVNAVADGVNRLAVKSDAVLLSHDDITPGSGDMRLALNKADAGGVASVVFQNGFSGRAEFGLAAGDLFELKVSANGIDFTSALSIDPADGIARLPQGAEIVKTNPSLILEKSASGESCSIVGRTGAQKRWEILLGDEQGETGDFAGSNFVINGYDDDGELLGPVFYLERANGIAICPEGFLANHGLIGYADGAGGTVTQATSKSTGVSIDAACGRITTHNATLNAGAEVGFTVSNAAVGPTDCIYVWMVSGGTLNSYMAWVDAVAAGSFHITITNTSTTNRGEALVLGFMAQAAVTS